MKERWCGPGSGLDSCSVRNWKIYTLNLGGVLIEESHASPIPMRCSRNLHQFDPKYFDRKTGGGGPPVDPSAKASSVS